MARVGKYRRHALNWAGSITLSICLGYALLGERAAIAQASVDTSGMPPVASTVVDHLDVFKGQVDADIFSTSVGSADGALSIPVTMQANGTNSRSPNWHFSYDSYAVCNYKSDVPGQVDDTYLLISEANKTTALNRTKSTQSCDVLGTNVYSDGSSVTVGTPYSAQGFTLVDRDGGVSYFYYDGDAAPVKFAKMANVWPIRKHIFPNGVVWTFEQTNGYISSVTSSSGYRVRISATFPASGKVYPISQFDRSFSFISTGCLVGCAETTIGTASITAVNSTGENYQYTWDINLNGIYLGRLVEEGTPASGAIVPWATNGYYLKGLTFASDTNKYRFQASCSVAVNPGCSGYSWATAMNDGNGRQTSIVYSSPDYRYTGDVYDRNGQHWKYTANYVVTPEDLNTPFLSSVVDPLNRTTSYTWDMAVGKLKTITKPGGEVLTASYDARGNELSTTTTPAGGGSPQIVRRIFPSSCTAATQRSCNKPTAIIDPRGNETDYQWSDVHGGLLTETLPADAAGFRSTNTYSYTAYTGIDGATFYLLTAKTETIDATHSRTTSYEYDVSDHWERKGEVVDVGGLALRTCFKHDPIGNLISKTAPRGGLTSCP